MNFSYDELVRLENEAMKRVQKINESERNTAERINRSITPPPKEEVPKPKHISMPANIQAPKIPSFFGLGEGSSDSSLLLGLLLLLGKEQTDTLTLLALVYILM